MSTKTMRPPPRRVLTASTGPVHYPVPNSNTRTPGFSNTAPKRKDRDEGVVLDGIRKISSPSTMLPADIPGNGMPKPGTVNANKGSESGPPPPNKQLLVAGYLAHEFLSKGTFFGQVWNHTRIEGKRLSDFNSSVSSDSKSLLKPGEEDGKMKPVPAPVKEEEDHQPQERRLKEGEDRQERYEELSTLLNSGRAHLPGIVNPSQLGRFLQL